MMFLKKSFVVAIALAIFTGSNCQEAETDYGDLFNTDTTESPVTESPVTKSPVTKSPVTKSPVTEPPVTDPPVTEPSVDESGETPVTDDTSLRAKVDKAAACGTDMKCVAYYLCSESGNVVTDGSFLIDERFDSSDAPKEELLCPAMEYCCSIDKTKLPRDKNQCKTYKAPAKCGFRNLRGLGDPVKSIQGTTHYANYAEFPWSMVVFHNSTYIGGGALIHPKVVLTAAHILKKSQSADLMVRGGEYNLPTKEEICPHVEKKVQKLIVHENYGINNLHNDAALLILSTPFELTASINTICLPPPNTVFDNKKCVYSGWGKKNFNDQERHQAFPKVLNLPVMPHSRCQEAFRTTRLGEDFILDKSFLCAGGEAGTDSCTGDGGSPLICESEQRGHWYVAGIVAGGISCGVEKIPGFYLKVTEVRAWIDQKLRQEKLYPGATLN